MTVTAEPSLLVDVSEAARLLHVHPNTIRNMTRDGQLPVVNLRRRRLYSRAALEAFVASEGGSA